MDKDWRVGAVHPDKVLFSPRRIYLGGKDKLSRVGILRSTGQARPEWLVRCRPNVTITQHRPGFYGKEKKV